MEIILREEIEKLGRPGDIVTVKNGYARNFLLPQKKAYLATPGNIKVMEGERAKIVKREAKLREEAEQFRDKLNQVEIRVERRVGEQDVLYGSVTSADIAEALEAKGFVIDKRKVLIDENIKQIGEFTVPIRLFPEVVAEVKLFVDPEGGETASASSVDAADAASEVTSE